MDGCSGTNLNGVPEGRAGWRPIVGSFSPRRRDPLAPLVRARGSVAGAMPRRIQQVRSVSLRPLHTTDAELLRALNRRTEVEARFGQPFALADAIERGFFAIDTEHGALGVVALLPSVRQPGSLELACVILEEAEDRRVASRAGRLILLTAGTRVIATIASDNAKARRLASAVGFRREGPVLFRWPTEEGEDLWVAGLRPSLWRRLRRRLRSLVSTGA